MPVTPLFDWEQTPDAVLISATIKGFKRDQIDVFISDTFVKVNAAPTYLLAVDLLHPIVVEKSSFFVEGHVVKITLSKRDKGGVWDTLCIDKATPHAEVMARRAAALARAEQLYNTKLDTREKQKEVEQKRMFHEHWEAEKALRREIETKVRQEREAEAASLQQWSDGLSAAPPAEGAAAATAAAAAAPSKRIFTSPGEISAVAAAAPPVRQVETLNVAIDFTPRGGVAMPSRTRGDEDYYRKSRYRPVSVEDAPMFWKERADKHYRARDFKAAADAYSESIKRDGCFMTCVSNRAACFIQMHEYKRAIEDCDLALTMLANMPASETTQERYRAMLTKLHARRGAAYAWDGDLVKAAEDLRLAVAYRNSSEDNDLIEDLRRVEQLMQERGLVRAPSLRDQKVLEASRFYYAGNYAGAAEAYRAVLGLDSFDARARSNLCATLLQQGDFAAALHEAQAVIEFCGEVANALNHPGAVSAPLDDSDDEDEAEDELVQRRNAAARKIAEKSGHVYLLLKAYVRASAALCGLKEFRKAHDMLEAALRITPYDEDLRDDLNRLGEKIRFNTLVGASTAVSKPGTAAAAAALASVVK